MDTRGRTDVTDKLSALLSHSTGILCFDPEDRFRCDGRVLQATAHDLAVFWNGAVIVRDDAPADRNAAHLSIRASDRVQHHDLRIEGPNPSARHDAALEAQHGIEVVASRHVFVHKPHVSNVHGDFVYVAGRRRAVTKTPVPSEAVWVHGLVGRVAGRQGMAVGGGVRDVAYTGSDLDEIARSAFDLEPAGSLGIEHAQLVGNVANGYANNFVASHGHGPVDRVAVRHNISCTRPIAVDVVTPDDEPARYGWQVHDNVSTVEFSSGRGFPMRFWRVDWLSVRRNAQPCDPDRTKWGVRAVHCNPIDVRDNDFPGATAELSTVR